MKRRTRIIISISSAVAAGAGFVVAEATGVNGRPITGVVGSSAEDQQSNDSDPSDG